MALSPLKHLQTSFVLQPDTLSVTFYGLMIIKFKHKGLKKFFDSGSIAGIQSEHVIRLRRILALLETAESPDDMDLPGLRLHPIKGDRGGTWSVSVSGNWRVTFQFQGSNVTNVDYDDYH